MDYRGIITKGYHVDAGGQNRPGIITQGYLSQITEAAFIASTRKIAATYESRKIAATYESRTIKGTA